MACGWCHPPTFTFTGPRLRALPSLHQPGSTSTPGQEAPAQCATLPGPFGPPNSPTGQWLSSCPSSQSPSRSPLPRPISAPSARVLCVPLWQNIQRCQSQELGLPSTFVLPQLRVPIRPCRLLVRVPWPGERPRPASGVCPVLPGPSGVGAEPGSSAQGPSLSWLHVSLYDSGRTPVSGGDEEHVFPLGLAWCSPRWANTSDSPEPRAVARRVLGPFWQMPQKLGPAR